MKPQAILVGAREVMAQSYRGVAVPEVALALMAHAGQFVTALLNQDTLASRAFLANVIALGELLLSRTDTDVTPGG